MRRKNATYTTTYLNKDGSKTIVTERVRGRHTTVSQHTVPKAEPLTAGQTFKTTLIILGLLVLLLFLLRVFPLGVLLLILFGKLVINLA